MATIAPFAALLPKPDLAGEICELPYDVLSTEEARTLAANRPLSFLHVSKPEIDLPSNTDPHAPVVYQQGLNNFRKLIEQGALIQAPRPAFYLYRQIMGSHAQLGLVALASCLEYDHGLIKKHELTRPEKEEDRVRHIEFLNAQTGPVFLTYRSRPELDGLLASLSKAAPQVDFTAPDHVRHSSWTIDDPTHLRAISTAFAQCPALYIADGHHRSAAASRVARARHGSGSSSFFLAVIFPHHQLRILPYNRVLKDLAGRDPAQLLEQLNALFTICSPGKAAPSRIHELSLYLDGTWHSLMFRPTFTAGPDPIETLDVTLLQKLVLEPLFGIDNPRTSERVAFVGGIRGTAELERLVQSGHYACAFSMFPTRIEDLMAIADQDGLMPPKSTWFEPKLRDAMFCHLLSNL